MVERQGLQVTEMATGRVTYAPDQKQARLEITPNRAYSDARLDNYKGTPRPKLPSRAPAGFSLRARASHDHPLGTLGFGFWNDPFTLSGGVLAAPSAVWFFYASPPADMALAGLVAGSSRGRRDRPDPRPRPRPSGDAPGEALRARP